MSNAIRRAIAHTTPGKPEQLGVESTDPVYFITTEFYIPELKGPIVLQPYQIAVLREAYRTDDQGRFVYSTVLWSDIKKSAKSSIAAAVCLERAAREPFASVKIIANDLKQAESRVAFYLRRAIELNPRLRSKTRVRNYKTTLANKSVIEAIPIDPTGEAGGNDDLICYSELWGAAGEAARRMWTEMTLSPTKYGKSQRWVETYAGFSGESEQLEQLYEVGVTNGRQLDLGIEGLEVYANDAAQQLTLWNTKPRCPWQTKEYYAQEAASLTQEEFNRVHRNQWASALSPFVPIAWFDACKVQTMPAIDKYREVVVALDAAVSDDCFGIIVLSREKKDLIDPRKGSETYGKVIGELDYLAVRDVKVWYPPAGGKMQYSNPHDPFDPAFPEGYVRKLAEEYNVIDFCYDPYQLHHFCNLLRAENIGAFSEFGQGESRLEADKQLYDLIRDRRIAHEGNADLRQHVENASKKMDGISKLRIVKRTEAKKIDLCVCLSMAAYKALKLLSA